MKILFIASSCTPFHQRTLVERPLGGTESAVIYLAQALREQGHTCYIATPHPNPPVTEPLYIPLSAVPLVGEVDVLVAVRDWRGLLSESKARVRCFWTGDSFDQPSSAGVGDKRVLARLNFFLAVSEWHRTTFCESAGIPKEQSAVLGNGVYLENFMPSPELARHPFRLIYSSMPYRGLHLMEQIMPLIRAQVPQAELHVFSAAGAYQGAASAGAINQEYQKILDRVTQVPGVIIRGNIRQHELAKEFLQATIFAYPNTFAETCCISALEAQAAGCIPVTSRLAALPETVGSAGILISPPSENSEYCTQFAAAVTELLQNPSKQEGLRAEARARISAYAWRETAARFEQIVQPFMPIDKRT